jgi:hypothetical protein
VDTLELLLHPVRVRIVHAMSGGRTRTTSDLCASLPDIPKTSLYRHVGLLEVAGEQRVKGAVERRYRLHRERAKIGREAAESMSKDDHRHAFAAAIGVLLVEFNAYLDRENADPAIDSVGYTQIPLWLSQDERAELIDELVAVIKPRFDNKAAPGRSPHLLSPILFPTEEPPQQD